MEEDFKILEEIKQSIDTDYGTGRRKVQAIENLINRNKELEKLELEHQKINGTLRERVKELEEDYTSVYLKGIYDERDKWKSKIKEMIEEIEKGNYSNRYDFPQGKNYGKSFKYGFEVGMLKAYKELLKGE